MARPQFVGDFLQPLLSARDEDQVVAARGEPFGIDLADAGRCAGHDGGAGLCGVGLCQDDLLYK
ncbi:hypothetical protein D3C72_2189850 [compost metagenome]